jgi:acyl-CoA synthetase (AMP-forming)/AMP-acid ligase II
VEDKCLYITGRKKDLIIKGGMNISPVLIEECVYKEKSVLENVIFAVKDGVGEERICCAYTLKNGCRENEKNVIETNIIDYVMKKLGKNYLIDYFWNIQDIPRNINGKIDKSKLRLMWETRNEQ